MKIAVALFLTLTTLCQARVVKKATPAKGALDDKRIEQAIRARFAESKIGVNHFEVHVQGGVATIEGRTDVIQHKGTATRLAKSVGAVRVVNRVEISPEARAKASASLAKGRRRAQLKRGGKRSERDGAR